MEFAASCGNELEPRLSNLCAIKIIGCPQDLVSTPEIRV